MSPSGQEARGIDEGNEKREKKKKKSKQLCGVFVTHRLTNETRRNPVARKCESV
jgi:hypothetical protein